MAVRVKGGVEPIRSTTGMPHGGSRSKPPKAVAHRASLEASRGMSDQQKAKRRLTAKTVAFAPAAETWARAVVLVKELYQVSRLAAFRQHLEECLEYPGATEPPKPLPYAVPFAIFPRECAPSYAVHSEVVNGF
jgi:hypothetical protein